VGAIQVAPGQLTAGAARLDAAGNELLTARAALEGVRSAGGAADAPAVAGAVEAFVSSWAATFVEQDTTIESLAQALRSSAGAYTATDQNAFGPASCPAGP
jgi:hypothetical protein